MDNYIFKVGDLIEFKPEKSLCLIVKINLHDSILAQYQTTFDVYDFLEERFYSQQTSHNGNYILV